MQEYIEQNDWDEDEVIIDILREDGFEDDVIDKIVALGEEFNTRDVQRSLSARNERLDATEDPAIKEMIQTYFTALYQVSKKLDERVEESIDSQDRNYDNAREQFEESAMDDDYYSEGVWFRSSGNRYMSDMEREMGDYDLYWPFRESSNKEFDYDTATELAERMSDHLGMEVEANSSYHGGERPEGTWIIEPDSSVEPDDDGEMPAEIISPPMPLQQTLEMLEKFVDFTGNENAYSNDSTGFHVGMSLPHVGGRVDYVKLALFLGDKYVLENFGRLGNTYCKSAFNHISSNAHKAEDVLKLLSHGLIELANRSIATKNRERTTSINMKGEYIEFRSAGGVDYINNLKALRETILRYAYAMTIAADPAAERKEYAKKLYKMLMGQGVDKDILTLFVNRSSGGLSDQAFKMQLEELRKRRLMMNTDVSADGTQKRLLMPNPNNISTRGDVPGDAAQNATLVRQPSRIPGPVPPAMKFNDPRQIPLNFTGQK